MAPSTGRVRLGRTNLDVSIASIGTGSFSRLGQEYGVERLHKIFGRVESVTAE